MKLKGECMNAVLEKFEKIGIIPVVVLDDAKDAISRQIGQDPNTLVMGQEVWESLKRNESLKGLIANSTNKIVTLDLLKEFFEIENIVVGKTIYSNANNQFERIWGNNIILAFVPHLNARTKIRGRAKLNCTFS